MSCEVGNETCLLVWPHHSPQEPGLFEVIGAINGWIRGAARDTSEGDRLFVCTGLGLGSAVRVRGVIGLAATIAFDPHEATTVMIDHWHLGLGPIGWKL